VNSSTKTIAQCYYGWITSYRIIRIYLTFFFVQNICSNIIIYNNSKAIVTVSQNTPLRAHTGLFIKGRNSHKLIETCNDIPCGVFFFLKNMKSNSQGM